MNTPTNTQKRYYILQCSDSITTHIAFGSLVGLHRYVSWLDRKCGIIVTTAEFVQVDASSIERLHDVCDAVNVDNLKYANE